MLFGAHIIPVVAGANSTSCHSNTAQSRSKKDVNPMGMTRKPTADDEPVAQSILSLLVELEATDLDKGIEPELLYNKVCELVKGTTKDQYDMCLAILTGGGLVAPCQRDQYGIEVLFLLDQTIVEAKKKRKKWEMEKERDRSTLNRNEVEVLGAVEIIRSNKSNRSNNCEDQNRSELSIKRQPSQKRDRTKNNKKKPKNIFVQETKCFKPKKYKDIYNI